MNIMSGFWDAVGYGFVIAMLVLAGTQLIRIINNRRIIRDVLVRKQQTLSTKEYYTIVFGILLIIQGSATITIYAPPFSGEYDYLWLLVGMFLIIAGALMEVHTQTNVKKSIQRLEDKIKELEKEVNNSN